MKLSSTYNFDSSNAQYNVLFYVQTHASQPAGDRTWISQRSAEMRNEICGEVASEEHKVKLSVQT